MYVYESTWWYMKKKVENESIWKCMKLYDGIWMHMKAYEYIWANMMVYESIW